jgi:UDPglucose--hexose-1-phosphate uridylyltransferase
MPSIRRHLITGEEIVFAPERAGRPNAFGDEGVESCPFCPGNETMTPPEIERQGDPWRVRVFPNKYPSVDGHEVIVESPVHGATFDQIGHAAEVVETYVRRLRAHQAAAHVAIFTNDGRRAGASIDHLHTQVMPLNFLPPRVAREVEAYASATACPLCAALDDHARDGLVIEEGAGVARIAPRGSSHAWEQWIVPRRHIASLTEMKGGETAALATALQRAVAAARRFGEAHNALLMNFLRQPSAHVYACVIPRRAAIGGFELASGTFIDIIDPAAAAPLLR